MLEILAATVAQEVTKAALANGQRWPGRKSVGRAERMAHYLALHQGVTRARLRIETLYSVHSAQFNIAHIAGWVTGYPLVVTLLNQLTDDLSIVTSDWQRLRLIADPWVAGRGDELVLALCGLMSTVDPGWHRPRARARHKVSLQAAKTRLTQASEDFDLACRGDAAPRWRDRRAARTADSSDLDGC